MFLKPATSGLSLTDFVAKPKDQRSGSRTDCSQHPKELVSQSGDALADKDLDTETPPPGLSRRQAAEIRVYSAKLDDMDGPPPAPPPSVGKETGVGWPCGGISKRKRLENPQNRLKLGKRQVARLKPLLCDMHRDFLQFSSGLGMLRVSGLKNDWKECARRKLGELRDEDLRLIENSTKMIMDMPELDNSGLIQYEDLVVSLLGTPEDATSLKRFRLLTNNFMEQTAENMNRVILCISVWEERAKRGLIDSQGLRQCVDELGVIVGVAPTEADATFKILMEELEIDESGQIGLADAIAHLLGRRKSPVELLLYDISAGYAGWFGRLLLGSRFEAIYHSSVLVFGREYWYGGKVFKSIPASESKNFGPPLTESVIRLSPSEYVPGLEVVKMGYTLATVKDWHYYVNKKLCNDFTVDSYDALSNNCNSFANAAVTFLTGGGKLPDEVTQQVTELMNTPVASMLRPAMNRYLGDMESASDVGLQDNTNDDSGGWCSNKRIEDCKGCPRRIMMLPCCTTLSALQAEERLVIEVVLPSSGHVQSAPGARTYLM